MKTAVSDQVTPEEWQEYPPKEGEKENFYSLAEMKN